MATISIQAKDFKTGDKVQTKSSNLGTVEIINAAGGIIGHGLYFETDKGEIAFNAAKTFKVERDECDACGGIDPDCATCEARN